jgi:hypothetical protein
MIEYLVHLLITSRYADITNWFQMLPDDEKEFRKLGLDTIYNTALMKHLNQNQVRDMVIEKLGPSSEIVKSAIAIASLEIGQKKVKTRHVTLSISMDLDDILNSMRQYGVGKSNFITACIRFAMKSIGTSAPAVRKFVNDNIYALSTPSIDAQQENFNTILDAVDKMPKGSNLTVKIEDHQDDNKYSIRNNLSDVDIESIRKNGKKKTVSK